MKHSLKKRILTSVALTLSCAGLVLLAACGQDKVSGGSTGASSGSAASCTTPTTTVLDYNVKQVGVGTPLRGIWSDVNYIPGQTAYPAFAYYDTGALSLKYLFWNGSSWSLETIVSDVAANFTFVRLVHLRTGTNLGKPLVFWTNGGTATRMAVRSTASLTATGTWTVATIDNNSTASRAVQVAVNPLDEVGVVFATNTAAGRIKFMYCDTSCDNPANYTAHGVGGTDDIDAGTAVIAASVNFGIAWCQVSSGDYYPAVTFGDAAGLRYAVCQQSSLASCVAAAGANWTKVTVTGSSAAVTNANLYLDETIAGDTPVAIAKSGAASLGVYKMGATACTAAPVAAWTAPVNLNGGTANTGTAFTKVFKDTTFGYYHAVANEATTNMRYWNCTNAGAACDPTNAGQWQNIGNVETVTMAAIGTTKGGAAFSPDSRQILTSYADTVSATTSGNMRVGVVNDYTVNSNVAIFSVVQPDISGHFQLPASPQQNLMVAATSTGTPGAVYVDFSKGAATTGMLKYAQRNGSTASSPWRSVNVPLLSQPQYPYLAYDNNNLPWISVFDAFNNRFYLLTNTRSDGSGSWSSYNFAPSVPAAPLALPAANQSAVTMYYSGGVAYPVIAVIDNNAVKAVYSAKFTPSTGTFSAIATVETLGASGGSHLTLDSDSSGNVIVGYNNITTGFPRFAYATSGTTWSTPVSISTTGRGVGMTVKINPATSKPAAAFYEQATNAVYYAACSTAIASCSAAGNWTSTFVNATGVSGLAAASFQFLNASLSFSSSGVPSIAYVSGRLAAGALYVGENSSGPFSATTLNAGANGNFTGVADINFGVAGWNARSVRTSTGALVSVYTGPGNIPLVTTCGDN